MSHCTGPSTGLHPSSVRLSQTPLPGGARSRAVAGQSQSRDSGSESGKHTHRGRGFRARRGLAQKHRRYWSSRRRQEGAWWPGHGLRGGPSSSARPPAETGWAWGPGAGSDALCVGGAPAARCPSLLWSPPSLPAGGAAAVSVDRRSPLHPEERESGAAASCVRPLGWSHLLVRRPMLSSEPALLSCFMSPRGPGHGLQHRQPVPA